MVDLTLVGRDLAVAAAAVEHGRDSRRDQVFDLLRVWGLGFGVWSLGLRVQQSSTAVIPAINSSIWIQGFVLSV